MPRKTVAPVHLHACDRTSAIPQRVIVTQGVSAHPLYRRRGSPTAVTGYSCAVGANPVRQSPATNASLRVVPSAPKAAGEVESLSREYDLDDV